MFLTNDIIMIIARFFVQLLSIIYIVFRFKRYFELKCNNNITGDALYRWEHVSIIDKYHLRERFLGGSRLRIKRDPKRYEIKYFYFIIIAVLLYVLFTWKPGNEIAVFFSSILLAVIVKIILDIMEKRKPVIIVLTILLFLIIDSGWAYLSIIMTSSEMATDVYGLGLYIPVMILTLIFLYSIFSKRFVSAIICGAIVISACVIRSITGKIILSYMIPVYTIGYMYVVLAFMQKIYNIKALKKITFIR